MQQIPSHEKAIRMLFTASTTNKEIEIKENTLVIDYTDELKLVNGWKAIKEVAIGDIIETSEGNKEITNIEYSTNKYFLILK